MKKSLAICLGAYMAFAGNLSVFAEEETTAIEFVTEAPVKASSLVLTFAGDCTLGSDKKLGYSGSFMEMYYALDQNTAYFLENVLPIFEKDDITTVNLEGPLTTAEKPAEKEYAFKGLPAFTKILTDGSVEAVNLANNHTYDYYEAGYKDTLSHIEQAGIYSFGDNKTAIIEANGIKTAFLGYKGWSDGTAIKNQITADIASSKKQGADIVIVNFHWGIERDNYPNNIQKNLGHHAIDAGADLVIGHHPHVIQGIETYQDKYIVYSLGNFCFGGNRNPADKDTFIFQIQFDNLKQENKSSTVMIYPAKISSVNNKNDFRPTLAAGDEANRIKERLITYSKSFNTSAEFINQAFENAIIYMSEEPVVPEEEIPKAITSEEIPQQEIPKQEPPKQEPPKQEPPKEDAPKKPSIIALED